MEERKDTIYDPQNGLYYKREGDYYIPLFILPESPKIGIWGKRRQDYLKTHLHLLYNIMWFKDTLNAHLEEVDRQATELYDRLIKEFATAEGVTEDLKASNQIEWVARMNNIHARVTEIVYSELILV